MVLRVIAHLSETDEGGPAEASVELDDVTLFFLDTVLAELKKSLRLDPGSPFDYFEYNEDGFSCNVKTNEEVQSLSESPPEEPLHVWLKSSRSHQKPNTPTDAPLNSADFVMIKEIASGQFGTVYLAQDVRNERQVAIKAIMIDMAMSAMQQEVEILSLGRDCPQIVQYFGAISEADHLKLILEFMDGLSLDRYGPLPIAVHGAATASIIDALSFLWSRNVIHRDIKPSNFLVNSKGEVKLADFGVSRFMLFSNARTAVGTVAYFPPERILGGEYSIESETWSLGLSLYEMALGSPSWVLEDDVTDASNIAAIILKNMPKISNELASIDSDLQNLVISCLKLNPHERIAPKMISDAVFVTKHRPIEKAIVAAFVISKQSVIAGSV